MMLCFLGEGLLHDVMFVGRDSYMMLCLWGGTLTGALFSINLVELAHVPSSALACDEWLACTCVQLSTPANPHSGLPGIFLA